MDKSLHSLALLCSESPISLAVIRELGSAGVKVIVLARDEHSFLKHSRFATDFVKRPDGPVVDWLPALAKEMAIGCVMAVSEGDLVELAQLKQGSGDDFAIVAPDIDALHIVLDKARLLAKAEQIGIQVPWSHQPRQPDLSGLNRTDLRFPIVAKWSDPLAIQPRLAAADLPFEKVRYLQSQDEAETFLRRFEELGCYPLLQEYCPGYGLGQMFHAVEGEITLRFQHRRLREWPLSGGVSSLCEAVPLDQHIELRHLSENLLRSLKWTGPAMVEYRYDPETDTARLMEVNGRFWGSLPLASAAQVHFARESYRQTFEPTPACQPNYKPLIARYMAPELKNLRDVWQSHEKLGEKLRFTAGFLGYFLNPKVRYYVFAPSDAMPFFADVRNALRKR